MASPKLCISKVFWWSFWSCSECFQSHAHYCYSFLRRASVTCSTLPTLMPSTPSLSRRMHFWMHFSFFKKWLCQSTSQINLRRDSVAFDLADLSICGRRTILKSTAPSISLTSSSHWVSSRSSVRYILKRSGGIWAVSRFSQFPSLFLDRSPHRSFAYHF